jgi:hypothetical protein
LNPGEDDRLRLRALDRLGVLAPSLAREALEGGVVEIEHDVLAWEGSLGKVHGHRVVLRLDPADCTRVRAAPSVVDALTAALASALSDAPGHALAELEILARSGPPPQRTAYRGRL